MRAIARHFEIAAIPDFSKMVKWIPKILFVSYSCESKPSFYVTVLPSEVSFSFYMVSTTKIGQKSVFSLNLPYLPRTDPDETYIKLNSAKEFLTVFIGKKIQLCAMNFSFTEYMLYLIPEPLP